MLGGADQLSRVAWLLSDPAVAAVLGVEAVPSQSTFSRFFSVFTQPANDRLARLHGWAAGQLPSQKEGYTLDLDSWALLHKDGAQEGVACGYTKLGLKPCHRPLIAALAEAKLVTNFWLRQGNSACVNGAAHFLRATLQGLPKHIRIGLLRADSGFANAHFLEAVEAAGLAFIVVARLPGPVQQFCRHDDAHWQPTEVPGLEVQEREGERPGRRLILVRQRIAQRPEAGGKTLLEVPGYRFQALWTNLPRSVDPLGVWRRYRGRADVENRIKELGDQFGIKGLCGQCFWATEAMYHLAIAAYTCVCSYNGGWGNWRKWNSTPCAGVCSPALLSGAGRGASRR